MRWLRQLACRPTGPRSRAGPGRSTSTSPCASRSCSTRRCREEPGGGGGRRAAVGHAPACAPLAAPALADGLRAALDAHPRAVMVAGRSERDPGLGEALAALADRSRCRCSPSRSGRAPRPAAIAHYDALLRDAGFAAAHAPDLVLRFGDLPTSKPLRQWLHGLDALQIAFDAEAAWQDPAGRVGTIVTADPRALAPRKPRKDRAWLDTWRRADHAAADAISRTLGASRSRAWPPSWACGCRRTRRSWSPPRCRCATSRRSSPPATRPPASSPTAAPTGSTARSRPPSASPPPAGRRCC